MRTAFILTVFAVLAIILLLHAALQWARREPGRKYPDGVTVWYRDRMRVVYRAKYHRGRWWYDLEDIEWQVRQEDIT